MTSSSIIDRNEINDLKKIDIKLFLPHFGYRLDPADRHKKSTFVRGDQVLKAFETSSGFWIARDFDKGESYSVIDLAFEVVGKNRWKEACDHIRSIINKPNPSPSDTPAAAPAAQQTSTSQTSQVPSAAVPQTSPDQKTCPDQPAAKVKKTTEEVGIEFETGSTIWKFGDTMPDYLRSRGITSLPEVFDRTFRVSDASGGIRFPHYALEKDEISWMKNLILAGLETRRAGQRPHYTKDGSTGIWYACGMHLDPRTVVVGESPIDLMSYAVMHHTYDDQYRYICLRSGSEHIAVDLIRQLIDCREIDTVIVATDNDHAGLTYAGRVLTGLIVDRREGEKYYGNVRAYYQAPPDGHDDWNDALQAR